MKYLYTLIIVGFLGFIIYDSRIKPVQKTSFGSETVAPLPQETQEVKETILKSNIDGNSMCFMGYCDGGTFDYKPATDCNVGDICVFNCLSKKCGYKGDSEFKLVSKKTVKGYYFVGDSKPVKCTANDDPKKPCSSLDSRYYGYINTPDIEITGIVIK